MGKGRTVDDDVGQVEQQLGRAHAGAAIKPLGVGGRAERGSGTHTHTHTHSHTLTHTQTHTHTRTNTHTQTRTRSHTHTHAHANSALAFFSMNAVVGAPAKNSGCFSTFSRKGMLVLMPRIFFEIISGDEGVCAWAQ